MLRTGCGKLASLIVLATTAGACATAPKADRPALVIPPPPPHVVPINSEPIVEPIGDIPGTPAPISGSARSNTRPASPKPAANDARPEARAGTEIKPPDSPPQPETPTPPAPTVPPPQLRTAESTGAEGAIRAMVDRARQMLSTIDYRKLTSVRRKAYDDAKKFADQADEALKQGNVVFAQGVAAKAETLARELSGR
jgi:hypothetical protein